MCKLQQLHFTLNYSRVPRKFRAPFFPSTTCLRVGRPVWITSCDTPYCRICSTCGVCGTKSRVAVTLESRFRGYDRLLRRRVVNTGKKLRITHVYITVLWNFSTYRSVTNGYVYAHVCARASSFLRVCGLDFGVHQSARYWTLLAGGEIRPVRTDQTIEFRFRRRGEHAGKSKEYDVYISSGGCRF